VVRILWGVRGELRGELLGLMNVPCTPPWCHHVPHTHPGTMLVSRDGCSRDDVIHVDSLAFHVKVKQETRSCSWPVLPFKTRQDPAAVARALRAHPLETRPRLVLARSHQLFFLHSSSTVQTHTTQLSAHTGRSATSPWGVFFVFLLIINRPGSLLGTAFLKWAVALRATWEFGFAR